MRARTDDHIEDKSSLKIIWITIIVSVFLGILIRKLHIGEISENTSLLYFGGIGFIFTGLIIRWIAIITLKKSFTVNVAVSKEQKLVQSGIYKYIRHPSYSGSLLSFFGLGIVFSNWLTFIIIFIPILFSFLYRIQVEEKVLQEAFGDRYKNYMQTSKKLIPEIF
jgi:protein-S-isoprenylcysteine O-methyltransferase Ste14